MKQFDDIFRENVKKAFSDYNAEHLAGEGWNSFVARQKGRRRRSALIPLWARAASLVLIVGLGVFFAYRIFTEQKTREVISATESAEKKVEEPVAINETQETDTRVVATFEKPEPGEVRTDNRAGEIRQISPVRDSLPELFTQENERIIFPEIAETRFLNPDILHNVSSTEASAESYEIIKSAGSAPDYSKPAGVISENLIIPEKAPEPEKSSGGTTLMAGFSGLIAQSEATSSPSSGLSMGFYLDQKITKRLSVRPGLALAMQSFGLENGNSPAGINYPVSLNYATNGTPYSYEGQLSMLAMELPLNLVFRIIEKERSEFYVSAGASTMFYISQQLTAGFVNEYTKLSYDNMIGEYSPETRYSTVEVEKDYGAFSRADFFGLANLSAGYSFPYSKTGTMLIEPFVQLPVSDLTSLDLKIRYAGVSMKLRFGKKDEEK